MLVEARCHPWLGLVPGRPFHASLLLTALPPSHEHQLHGKQNENDRRDGHDEPEQRVVVPRGQGKWESTASSRQSIIRPQARGSRQGGGPPRMGTYRKPLAIPRIMVALPSQTWIGAYLVGFWVFLNSRWCTTPNTN